MHGNCVSKVRTVKEMLALIPAISLCHAGVAEPKTTLGASRGTTNAGTVDLGAFSSLCMRTDNRGLYIRITSMALSGPWCDPKRCSASLSRQGEVTVARLMSRMFHAAASSAEPSFQSSKSSLKGARTGFQSRKKLRKHRSDICQWYVSTFGENLIIRDVKWTPCSPFVVETTTCEPCLNKPVNTLKYHAPLNNDLHTRPISTVDMLKKGPCVQ